MGHEQINLNLGSLKNDDNNVPESRTTEPHTISYSETLPKSNESDNEYATRIFELNRKNSRGEIIIGKPNQEDINIQLELSRQEKLKQNISTDKNSISKEPVKPVIAKDYSEDVLKAKIERMKRRKDLDY